MRRAKMRLAATCALAMTLVGPAIAAGQNQPNGKTGGAQHGQAGLFPPNEPAPMSSSESSGNAANASLQHPGVEPNAGNTGAQGSVGTRTGWTPQGYKPTQ